MADFIKFHHTLRSTTYDNSRGVNNRPGVPNIFHVLGLIVMGLILLAFVGCKAQQPLVNTIETVRTEKEIMRDTVISTNPDSATVKALLECDSTNKVILRRIEILQGERIKPSVDIRQNTDGSTNLIVECKEDSLRHEIQIRDKIIEELKNSREQVPVEIEKKGSAFWKGSGIAFWVLIGMLVLGAAIGLIIKFAK